MQLIALSALLALSATAVGTMDISDTDSNVSKAKEEKNQLDRTGKLFAFRTSTSRTLIASTTVLALSTCITSVNTVACTGRKRKNISHDFQLANEEYAYFKFNKI